MIFLEKLRILIENSLQTVVKLRLKIRNFSKLSQIAYKLLSEAKPKSLQKKMDIFCHLTSC